MPKENNQHKHHKLMQKVFRSGFNHFKENPEDFGVNMATALKIKTMHPIHSKSLLKVAEKQLKVSLMKSGNETLEALAGGIKVNIEEKHLVTVMQHTVKHILKDPKNPLHNIEKKFSKAILKMSKGDKDNLVKSIGNIVGKENAETLEDKLSDQANKVWHNLSQELDNMLIGFIAKTKDNLSDLFVDSSSESESSSESSSDESSNEDIVTNKVLPTSEESADPATAEETATEEVAVEEVAVEEDSEPTDAEETLVPATVVKTTEPTTANEAKKEKTTELTDAEKSVPAMIEELELTLELSGDIPDGTLT